MKKQLLFFSIALSALHFVSAQDKKTAEECFKKADYQCAEEQYSKLVLTEHIQRYQSEYYNLLGTSQRRLGKTAQAFKSYESALRSDPKSVSVYENLASLHNQKGNRTKALEYINTGIRIEPENAELYLTRSKIYNNLGKKDLAMEDLKHILTFAPDNIFARTGLANLKKNNGDLDGALKDYNQLLSEKPESLLYNGRADIYLKMKKTKEALADINKAITIDPKFSQSYVTKAAILFETGKDKEACTNLEKAVAAGYEKVLLQEYNAKCSKK
ncbi:tetratricopeptide repeat protein [Chryseobacterium binzhouense]|uniref:tetratricopeptide repeat protein n=1 Tax=Chryseobacterium binzhouense TaxID=2593646 RepID=UPI0011804E1E|nr:tetratricopeptide repeat protein [Chryseobacterium binzhouense]